MRESGGQAVAVEDEHIMDIRDYIAREDGVLLCPEGSATAAAYQLALQQGWGLINLKQLFCLIAQPA